MSVAEKNDGKKGGSLPWSALGPDLATMADNDVLDRGQTDPVAFNLRSGQLLKRREQLFSVCHGKAGAATPHFDFDWV